MNEFDRRLESGKVAEGLIAAWLKSRGNAILPAYQVEQHTGKGPQLFSAEGAFVAPDMLAFTHEGITWIEAKHKSVFTWHRATSKWTTGIDLRHYVEYLRVSWRTKHPVWLMFYHREATPAQGDLEYGCPLECPTGLFGGELFRLVGSENHRSKPYDASRTGFLGHGKSGMVYWAVDVLRPLATKDECDVAMDLARSAA